MISAGLYYTVILLINTNEYYDEQKTVLKYCLSNHCYITRHHYHMPDTQI